MHFLQQVNSELLLVISLTYDNIYDYGSHNLKTSVQIKRNEKKLENMLIPCAIATAIIMLSCNSTINDLLNLDIEWCNMLLFSQNFILLCLLLLLLSTPTQQCIITINTICKYIFISGDTQQHKISEQKLLLLVKPIQILVLSRQEIHYRIIILCYHFRSQIKSLKCLQIVMST